MNPWRLALAGALVAAAWLLLAPSPPVPTSSPVDKIEHVALFAALAVLAALAFPAQHRGWIILALALAGGAAELAQAATGRTPDALDAAANALGATAAFLVPRSR